MPFGLNNAPAVFQIMGLNLADAPDFVSVYIDDVLIYSKTLEEHLEHIEKVLRKLIEVGLKLKPEKFHFIRKEVGFLGHVITPDGLKTSQQHNNSCSPKIPNARVSESSQAVYGIVLIIIIADL